MSWFDATGFANLAKSALKEAQKTIDKALDIKEDENVSGSKATLVPSEDLDSGDNFFSSWAVDEPSTSQTTAKRILTPTPTSSNSKRMTTSTSLWGSFTGSFFENPKATEGDKGATVDSPNRPTNLVSDQPKKSSFRSLSLDLPWSGGEPITTPPGREDDKKNIGDDQKDESIDDKAGDEEQQKDDGASIREEIKNFPPVEVVFRERKPRNYSNRLSAISSESDRRSSESCEVLGSSTPDSERTASISTSSSVARLRQSGSFGSVEVLTSPSSVEVLGSTSSHTSSDEVCKDKYSSDSISPVAECEGVEVIPELMEDEEEMSLAEDSYTSASESTLTATVLEFHQPDAMKDLMFKSTSSLDTSFSEGMSPRDCTGSRSSVNLIFTHTSATSQNISPLASTESTSNSATSENLPRSSSTRVSELVVSECINKTVDSQSETQKVLDSVKSNHQSVFSSLPSVVSHKDQDNAGVSISSNNGSESFISKTKTRLVSDSDISSIDMYIATTVGDSENISVSSDTGGVIDNASSSCEEGTLMGSSTEEVPLHVSTSASSSCLKNMLADAMSEKAHLSKEQSPMSSESRSEPVKVGSSGHTSGDELETATSSDIEIISSPTPNGDSSSAASRHSPAKLVQPAPRPRFGSWLMLSGRASHHEDLDTFTGKQKGHQREPSETSSGGSDDCSEAEKLLKKISELTEILEARESKLIDLSRINADLQETNSDLKSQLESQDTNQMSEEYMQRLAALERKFQQAIREKEVLRKQLEHAKAAALASEKEAEEEKDQVIAELREEGEKLSKQQLALNNAIKKLRAMEKENQKTISSLKEQLEEASQELERAKKALSAKEEVERMQIEAVHQLTKNNQRLEKEISTLQSQVDSLTSTLVTCQRELEESRLESASLRQQVSEAVQTAEAGVRERLEDELEAAATQHDSLKATVHDLRDKLTQTEQEHLKRESELRQENLNLLRRLEAAELRAEEYSESVTTATRPLLRQIEALTSSSNTATASWEKQEKRLNQTINDLKSQLSSLSESERASREECSRLNNRSSTLESKLSSYQQEIESLNQKLTNLTSQNTSLREDSIRLNKELAGKKDELKRVEENSKKELAEKDQQLTSERAALDAEKLRNATLQESIRNRGGSGAAAGGGAVNVTGSGVVISAAAGGASTPQIASPRSSPTLSFGHASVAESFSSTVWPNFGDDVFESGSTSGRLSSVYESLRPGHTSLLEGLQAQLKLRDGEVHQLQWELSRRELERAALRDEVAALTAKTEEQELQLTTLSTQYDALLQMYGEKMEESQELRMDLQDIKDMYKAQIDQLLKKEPSVNS
ncbi:uncharacterized protein LOC142327071 isoform X2 [Lycorma delicatula]|uniref:uncharacterized protein LOC142327071 isoform X2 n=1 Tax=Lycorma delicatula TaxID=130591 RepID=UPI003F5184E9